MPTKDQLTKFDSRSRYRLRCASCGTVLDGRQRVAIYTGDGDAWLHDADEDGSAACGPVLAEWPALAAPEGRPAVAVGDVVISKLGNRWTVTAVDGRLLLLHNVPPETPDARGTIASGPMPEWAAAIERDGVVIWRKEA